MPLDNHTRLQAVREAGYVERCHVAGRTGDGYNLAQHQWGVSMICMLLWPGDHALLRAALTHDIPERWTGDIPGQVLGSNTVLRQQIEDQEKVIMACLDLPMNDGDMGLEWRLRGADRLDLWLWTLEEERRHGSKEFAGFRTLIERAWAETPPPDEVLAVVQGVSARNGWHRLPENFHEVLQR